MSAAGSSNTEQPMLMNSDHSDLSIAYRALPARDSAEYGQHRSKLRGPRSQVVDCGTDRISAWIRSRFAALDWTTGTTWRGSLVDDWEQLIAGLAQHNVCGC